MAKAIAVVAAVLTMVVMSAQPAAAVWRGEREYCKHYKCVHLVVNHSDWNGDCEALAIRISAVTHPAHGAPRSISIDGLRLRVNGVTVRDTGYLHWSGSSASSFSTDWYASTAATTKTAYIYQFRVRYADGFLSSNDPDEANFVSNSDSTQC